MSFLRLSKAHLFANPGELASFEATVANLTFGVDESQMIPVDGGTFLGRVWMIQNGDQLGVLFPKDPSMS